MTQEKLIDAITDLDSDILHRYFDMKADLAAKKKPKKRAWVKWASLAACFCFLLTAVAIVVPHIIPNDIGEQQPDKILIEIINGYEYVQLKSPESYYLEKYPKLKDVATKTVVGYEYDLTKESLGDYIGIVPAYKTADLPEGKAYHWSEYPYCDTIIIVERNGEYAFYVSDGNNLSDDIAKDSSSVMQKHDMPDSILSIEDGDTKILISDKTTIAEICSILAGKEKDTKHTYRNLIWQDWLDEKGESGVHFDGNTFTYDNADINRKFAAFYGANIKTIRFKLRNDFEITLRFDSKYNYFMMCNNCYNLSDDETVEIVKLLGIE